MPAAVVEAVASVRVLEPPPGAAMLVGAKVGVTPLGNPLTDRATAALNPFTRAVERLMGIELPAVTLPLPALTRKVKLGVRTVRLKAWVRVMPPPAAVRVRVNVPGAAEEATANVSVLELPGEVMLAGANVGVTPLGNPVTDRATAGVNPFTLAMVRVTGVDPPGATLALLEPAVRVKLGGGATVRLSAWVLVTPPPLAVMDGVDVPAAAEGVADNVKVLEPLPGEAMLVGAKVGVTPAGSPVMEKVTAELKPLAPVVVRVMGVELPWATLGVVRLAARVKVGGPVTVRLMGWSLVVPPPTAPSVTV